ncbi:DUF58 domain-containing protein [Martelella mediterranea]|uniref:Uncharacterized protein DUF58 n=1 Tax=Martelella mediterranea TaxID=293089 RepID=A0A4R3NY66_9HYPH|nr:DUF58 domain-containing protein [Martelella mediterranea]TCT44895.1 uncharacterized protein DUF58 [Martelella mediterranea]
MISIGESILRTTGNEALSHAKHRAALLPDCLVEARRIANTVTAGWHGRRRRGPGENFWQFRPYVSGESLARIDWRRSARDDHTYVRDMEWEAAHTVWLFADLSSSMLFQSRLAPVSKEHRALVLLLALTEMLLRSGERVGYPGLMEPVSSRNGAETLAHMLAAAPDDLPKIPDTAMMRGPSELIVIGDFLDRPEALFDRIAPLSARGLTAHLVEVADPAEESFPYTGRTAFSDPETGQELTIGRAEALRERYLELYQGRRRAISERAVKSGWSFVTHHTDRPASEALTAVHMRLSGETAAGGRR